MQPFKILKLETDFIVVAKAAGQGFHDEQTELGLVPGLCRLLHEYLLASDESNSEVYPVHRLDKVTSGVLVFARSSAAAALLAEEFAHRRVEKYYLALSDRKPKKKQGSIIGDMVKARRGTWKLLPQKQAPAKTQFYSHSIADNLRLFCLRPYSGKTHQLRVALKSLASPICGDSAYGGSQEDKGREFKRVFLHSFLLAFNYMGQNHEYRCLPELDAAEASDFYFDWHINDDLIEAMRQGFEKFTQARDLHWSIAQRKPRFREK